MKSLRFDFSNVMDHLKVKIFSYDSVDLELSEMDKGEHKINYKELLKGKTLQVYWFLLTQGTAGVREIMRALEFSSPGIVSYQLNKLLDSGIVAKNEESGKYFVREEVRSGIFGFYVRFGYLVVPRFTIYLSACIFGLMMFLFLAFLWGDDFILHPSSLILLFCLILGVVVFVVESRRIRNLEL